MHGTEGILHGTVPAGAWRRHLWRGLGLGLTALAAAWLSLATRDRALDALLIWLPGPCLLAALLSSPLRYWPSLALGGWAGLLLFARQVGLSWPLALLLSFAMTVLVGLAAWSFRRRYPDAALDRLAPWLSFVGLIVLALPLVTGCTLAVVAAHGDVPPWLAQAWWQLALANALGYVLLTPAVLAAGRRNAPPWRVRLADRPMLLAVAIALGVLWLGWRELGALAAARPLLLLAPLPLVIYVAWRAQLFGAAMVNLLVAAIAIQLSLDQLGPFVQARAEHSALSLQLWMLGMAAASLYLAVLVARRRDARRALAARSAEVRELAGRLIVVQEQERARIARDLHDDLSQRLALASLRLSALRQKVDEATRLEVDRLQGELIALSEDVRQLSHDLHPSLLAQTGLTAALASLCQNLRQHSGPCIALRVSPQAQELPEEIALCLYRVAQEGLGNALRHAEASSIDVGLRIGPAQVNLTITDDGKGFAAKAQGRRGLGLVSIDERTKSLGGSYRLQSIPGKGTELCIRLPLERRRTA